MTPSEQVLTDGELSVSISLHGGILTGASFGGRSFLLASGPGGAASFPMLPLCNRVSGNRFAFGGQEYLLSPNTDDPLYLHGDGWLADWQLAKLTTSSAVLTYTHGNGPFRYYAEQEVWLAGSTLHMRLSLLNTGDVPMPFGLGFHPYFPRAGASVTFDAQARWTEAPGHLPGVRQAIPPEVDFSTPRPLPATWQNNAYEGWQRRATIRWPGLRLEMEADPVFAALMLYAPDTQPDFFCREPMTHLPDALNMPDRPGLHVLATDEDLTGKIQMTRIKEHAHD